ncbi:hypothetical protein DWX82_12570 [Odoribacter sp. AF21-41]|nr:hypothetical protein DWX82_12570 [Odoribacter sp. AF21-41]RHH96741.1 hypothetical protein DW186_04520 [Odoribacter sp. AM16-33]
MGRGFESHRGHQLENQANRATRNNILVARFFIKGQTNRQTFEKIPFSKHKILNHTTNYKIIIYSVHKPYFLQTYTLNLFHLATLKHQYYFFPYKKVDI